MTLATVSASTEISVEKQDTTTIGASSRIILTKRSGELIHRLRLLDFNKDGVFERWTEEFYFAGKKVLLISKLGDEPSKNTYRSVPVDIYEDTPDEHGVYTRLTIAPKNLQDSEIFIRGSDGHFTPVPDAERKKLIAQMEALFEVVDSVKEAVTRKNEK